MQDNSRDIYFYISWLICVYDLYLYDSDTYTLYTIQSEIPQKL